MDLRLRKCCRCVCVCVCVFSSNVLACRQAQARLRHEGTSISGDKHVKGMFVTLLDSVAWFSLVDIEVEGGCTLASS